MEALGTLDPENDNSFTFLMVFSEDYLKLLVPETRKMTTVFVWVLFSKDSWRLLDSLDLENEISFEFLIAFGGSWTLDPESE